MCGHTRRQHESFGAGIDEHRTDGQCWGCDLDGHGVPCLSFVSASAYSATAHAVCLCGHPHPVRVNGTRTDACGECGCHNYEFSPSKTLAAVRHTRDLSDCLLGKNGGAELHDVNTLRRVLDVELTKLGRLESMAAPTHVRGQQLSIVLVIHRHLQEAERVALAMGS